jgi:competence protein ComEA
MDAWLDRYKGLVVATLVVAVIAGGGLVAARQSSPAPLTIQTAAATPGAAGIIKVHVTGEVARPGVYTFKNGDRVEDAVAAAGGPTADGVPNALNLAARLVDGQQVIVPRAGEPTAAAASPAASRRVSINTATLAELDTLPGIGPATGQKILDYRTRNGPFQRIEDLLDLKLVPASTFDNLKDLITL